MTDAITAEQRDQIARDHAIRVLNCFSGVLHWEQRGGSEEVPVTAAMLDAAAERVVEAYVRMASAPRDREIEIRAAGLPERWIAMRWVPMKGAVADEGNWRATREAIIAWWAWPVDWREVAAETDGTVEG